MELHQESGLRPSERFKLQACGCCVKRFCQASLCIKMPEYHTGNREPFSYREKTRPKLVVFESLSNILRCELPGF
jgi:hypothetical protein